MKKWEKEKDTLPKDQFGKPKTVSKKAWIKRNDKRKIIDIEYQIGSYSLFSNRFSDMTTTCPTTDYGYSQEYTGEHIAHQWFHDLLRELYLEEKNTSRNMTRSSRKLQKLGITVRNVVYALITKNQTILFGITKKMYPKNAWINIFQHLKTRTYNSPYYKMDFVTDATNTLCQ